ncbi:MAG: ATP-binding cassette domain-containing protein [Eubacterium sp.]|nr:ATP-binding cassette domain-containing protein [Eubacterium sp.]
MEGKALVFDKVTKTYGKLNALDGFTAVLEHGIYGLLGPNGSGKSTLMKCIADIIRPTSGNILYGGESIYGIGKGGADFRRVLGFMPQDLDFYPSFSGYDIIKYFALLKGVDYGKADIEKALDDVNLLSAAKKHVGGWSGGMKRRLGIAVTLIGEPEILIFDEPTAGLDPEERLRFKNLIREMGASRTVILATHIISDIEAVADYTLFIKNGSLINTVKNDKAAHSESGELEQLYMDSFGHHSDTEG